MAMLDQATLGAPGTALLGLWTIDIPPRHHGRCLAPGPHLLHLLLRGSYALDLAGQRHRVRAGDAIWYRDGEAVGYRGEASAVRFWSCRFDAPGLIAPAAAGRVWRADDGFRAAFAQLVAEHGVDRGAPWRRQAALCALVAAAAAAQAEPEPDGWSAIEAWVLQRGAFDLRLDQLAAAHGVSQPSLDRWCRRTHGCGPGRRLRALRLERALELLRQTSLPVGLVAERLGYRDGAELARACRRAHGRSPSQLRDSA